MKRNILLLLVFITGFVTAQESFGKEYTETCGDYTPTSVLLKKYYICNGGWCLRK